MDKGIILGLGIIVVGIVIFLLGKNKSNMNVVYHKKSSQINDLFYKQHKLLFELRSFLVDQKKTEEIVFFEKQKFLSDTVSQETLDNYLINGQKEIDFLINLKK